MSFSFGSNATSQSGAFGATAKPSFSFGNTNTATTSTAGFAGFGTNTSSSGFGGFGATTSSAAPFGGLGSAPATSSAPSLFGAGGFGAAAKPATGFGNTSFGGSAFGTGAAPSFGANTSTFGSAAPTFGSTAPAFGSTAPSFGSTAPAFGSTAPAFGSTAPAFGSTAPAFGSTAPAFGSTAPNFGGSTFGAGSTFGSAFGAKPATGFGGFGTGLGTTNTFGQPQQQQQQPGPATAHEALVAAVFNCNVFGDERDQVLAKWNLLQAQWGTGKAYYSRTAPPLELNEQNPLCRFKAVGYARLGGRDDKEGRVALLFNKTDQEIKTNRQTLTTSLTGLLGNKPNLVLTIDTVTAVSDNKTQVVISVVDNNAGGTRISASELANFLKSGTAASALAGAGCGGVSAATPPAPQALQQYLQAPPPGMDIRMWKQAQADNPDPDNYVPVPIIGFTEIKFRSSNQAEQASLQASFLKKARDTLVELRARRAAAAARLAQLAAAHRAHRHMLLQVIARQEVIGRVGAALSPEEEATRARLHELASQLAAPPLHNGRLNELLCAVRLQRSASTAAPHDRYQLDAGAQEDMKQFLTLQQRGMAHLLDTARQDLAALNTIDEGMARLVRA